MKIQLRLLVILAVACIIAAVGLRTTAPSASTNPVAVLTEPSKPNDHAGRVVHSNPWKSSDRRHEHFQTISPTPSPQQTLFTGSSSDAQLDAAREIAAQGTEQAAETLAEFIAKAEESSDPVQQQLAHDVAAVMRQMTSDAALPMMMKLAYHPSETVAEAAVDAAVARDPIPIELQQDTIEPTLQLELDNAAQTLLNDLIWGNPAPTTATSDADTSQ